MKGHWAAFRIRFIHSLQYRAAALAGLATQFAWGFMQLLAFGAFYRADPGAFPMTYAQTASYIWLQQAFLALFMTWFYENEIFEAIRSGDIAYQLARPMGLYGRWFSQSVANRLARAALRCLPVLALALLLPAPMGLAPPRNLMHLALFLISMGLGLCVVVAFSMLVYISCLYTLSAIGVRVMAAALVDFMAGAIVPLPFFPAGFQAVAELLPFAAMQNLPLRIYSGQLMGAAMWQGMALQVFWLAALVGLGRAWMRRALRRVVVQGG